MVGPVEEVLVSFNSKAQCLGVFMQGGEESAFQAPGTARVEGGELNWPERV